MPYLKVECYVCGAVWNYYQEKRYYLPMLTTQVDIQGGTCPNCGGLGVIASIASGSTDSIIQVKKE